MDDDLLPKGFYNQPKHANLPRDQRIHPQSNQVPTNADENLPENFYKFRPTATNFDRSSSGPTAWIKTGYPDNRITAFFDRFPIFFKEKAVFKKAVCKK